MTNAGTLEIDGARIHYELTGFGPPVVLLHGAWLDTRMWAPQVPVLAQHFTLLNFDQRGHGRSTLPSEPYRSHEDIRRIVETLGLERPHLVGLSMGGRFAIDYALAYSDGIGSLVVSPGGISGYQYEDPEFDAAFGPIVEAAARGDLAEANRLLLDFEIMRRAARHPVHGRLLATIVGDHSWQAFTEPDPWLDAERPALEHLGEISAPTLVIAGEHEIPDHVRQANLLVAGIPGARLVRIAGASHMVNLEAPERYNELLLEFLLAVGPAGAPPPFEAGFPAHDS